MSIPVVIFLSAIILTVTHGLDGILKHCDIKKSMFLLYMAICFAISITPVYNINRFFSVHLLFIISVLSFIALLRLRRKTLLAAKEITFIFFTAFLFILETICGLLLNNMDWFFYLKLTSIILYCTFYIEKPADAAICAGFGIWLMQFLLILKNFFLDAYLYFDLGNSETAKVSSLYMLGTFILSLIALLLKERKKGKKGISEDMELFTPTDKNRGNNI